MTHIARCNLLIIASVLIALPRVLGVKHEAYQALVHLYVGCLIGLYMATRKIPGSLSLLYLGLIVSLSVLEVLCFAAGIIWPVGPKRVR